MVHQRVLSQSFGELLKTYRKRQRLTQKHLAQHLDVHMNTISSWELGTYLPATRGLVLELARCLALSEPETRQLLEASLTALAPHWSVPLPRNPYFTGREEVLEALHAQLGIDQAVALTQSSALHGLGGVGKTQIALEYAYRHALEYSAVFWIGAETDEQVVTSFLHIAETLRLPERQNADQQQMIAAVQRWLATHEQWLLIWDNVEDLPLLDRFLPARRAGALLITTRHQALGTFAQGLDLLPMELEEGTLLLLRRAKVLAPSATKKEVQHLASSMPEQYSAAVHLVTVLGGLPLALDQAGAYIEEAGCNLTGYLQRYEQQRLHLLDRRGDLGQDHPQSVATTLLLSMERVEREQDLAADLLRVCALLHADAIPEEFFLGGATALGPTLEPLAHHSSLLDQASATLRRFSLVQRHPETRTLSLHRLVQTVRRESMSQQEQVTWLKRVSATLCTVFPALSHNAWTQCERLLPHVSVVAAATIDDLADQSLAEVLRKAADYLRDRAQYAQAQSFYQRALHLQEHLWGPEHPEVAKTLDGLAVLFFRQGKYEQIETLYQRALQIWEQTLEPEDPTVARSLYGLARLKLRQGNYIQAEPLYRRALCIWEQTLGSEHPDVAKVLDGLAILSLHLGKYEQAEWLDQRALQIWEQALGSEHPLVAYPLVILGEIAYEQGRDEQAEQRYRRCLHIREQALGPDHPEVAYTLQAWAALLRRQGKYEQAESLYRRSLQIWEQALGAEHAEIAESLNGLANLYRSQGKHAKAASLYEQALQLREQHLGQTHPETAETLHDLALLRMSQGKSSEARSLAERALAIRAWSLGDTHPKTSASRTLLAQIEERQGMHQQGTSHSYYAKAHPDRVNTALLKEGEGLTSQATSDRSQIESDSFQEFLIACCEVYPRAWCRSADLWRAYLCWTQKHQERFPLSRRTFAARLTAQGCSAARTNTARIWRGITLRSLNP
jgi:tetratricopeptide (TPR) repeat protein